MEKTRSFNAGKSGKGIAYLFIGIFFLIGLIIVWLILHFFQIRIEYPELTVSGTFHMLGRHALNSPFDIVGAIQKYGISIFSILGFGIILLLVQLDIDKQKKHDDPDTVNGDAKWMDTKDYEAYCTKYTAPYGKPTIDSNQNIILSQDIRLGLDGNKTRRNLHVLCIGGSGAGKSRFFISPNILQFNTNFIITDPSGELLSQWGKALEDNGYLVKTFNITDMYKSCRYNPFHYINREQDVFILVDTLMTNINGEQGSSDKFWDNSTKLLLYAIMLYLWHKMPEEEQTMSNVFKLVNMANIDENNANAKSPLDKLFEAFDKETDGNSLACDEYRAFKHGACKTLKSIVISAISTFKDFRLEDIQYLLSGDDLELDKFADRKQALFIIIPTGVGTFNYIVSIMYSQLFNTLYRYAEGPARYGTKIVDAEENVLRVFRADEQEDKAKAAERAQKWLSKVKKHGFILKENKKKNVVEIRDRKTNELISWRGDKSSAKSYEKVLLGSRTEECAPQRCPIQISIMLDEFANIGQIPQFDKILSTIRKYGMNCFIVLQSLAQLKNMYKDSYSTIIGNCDTKLLLGTDDQETNEYFTKDFGNKTTRTANQSFGKETSLSVSSGQRTLITMDLLKGMKENECIVMIRGIHPHYGFKYELTKHPNYNYANSKRDQFRVIPPDNVEKPDNNIPFRLRKKEDTGTDFMGYDEGVIGNPDAFVPVSTNPADENIKRKTEAAERGEEPDKEQDMNEDAHNFLNEMGLDENSSDEEIKQKAVDEFNDIVFADAKDIKIES